ncbi:sugar kinase [Tritonibacter horizontis]|uniref:2-dehydro-3-deoxygluconokinase n=1 Tax=Tritonibacter horizontis TaxID=1768241 RepID=A0A132BRB5_9RHOB|nr:sugar kinase [Tritonibacter horizontis]KUP90552.1 2-dehydro-3-deoxygluconokinase [Tritonibacter horizontis]
MMKYQLVAIGEAMAELRQDTKAGWSVGFAGDTFNTAVYSARALAPGAVAYVTRVGEDPLSEGFCQLAAEQGIVTDEIRADANRNIGLYSVKTDKDGERSFHYWRSASAARSMFAEAATTEIPAAKIVYYSAITLAILAPDARARLFARLEELKSDAGCLIAFDSNYRPKLWEDVATAQEITAQAWAMADIALPSIDDEMALFGDADEASVLARFAQKTWVAGALKRGPLGPVPLANPQLDVPAFEAAQRVVDTTAAGDSFNGAYLAAFLQEREELDCLKAGHDCAKMVVGHPGAIAPLDA